ncbi:FAD-binding oxidoreductase [Halobacillus halophilus]|uniref:FAD dependent oxidoreductase domain-containing protein n=1 Tax=Halobacillus halophilus (strain ATCC 35676 / DSM 2266 / JCM 20832 / KCTC 3685 / LMG 17431 / NBRC 102448 / NCIMB 2269) TaxID=866895 RepID=I0JIG6_HALH3|nr:FAD-dependent oxidoreductase [Halobacillus halophilus]ASF38118.1 FAD-binding oxidoreductase [Halobacillus halophilus]CCG43934.1 hypothetical protein HBHAL_1565 [Halobacillus halophilus DSM 2266]
MVHQLPERSFPLWRDQSIESFPALTENTEADVTVIGSGITGIITAYLLMKKGYSVVILEAGKIVEGTTGYLLGLPLPRFPIYAERRSY